MFRYIQGLGAYSWESNNCTIDIRLLWPACDVNDPDVHGLKQDYPRGKAMMTQGCSGDVVGTEEAYTMSGHVSERARGRSREVTT